MDVIFAASFWTSSQLAAQPGMGKQERSIAARNTLPSWRNQLVIIILPLRRIREGLVSGRDIKDPARP
jgi:hypothetical protein